MPITGSDPALMYALSGVGRSGATRSGYHSAKVFISIAGIQRAVGRESEDSKILIDSLTINETQGEPYTASMVAMGFVAAAGQEIVITSGSINNLDPDFAGHILSADQTFVGKDKHRQFGISAVDRKWQLNRIKVIGRFSGPANEIVTEIMTAYAPEWDLSGVEADLPEIEEFSVIEPSDLTEVLTRLVNRVGQGCRWEGSHTKRLYFGLADDPSATQPQPVTSDNETFLREGFSISRDRSQQATRVHMEGGGSVAAADIDTDETIVPVEDASDTWFDPAGGTFVSGPQRCAYGRVFAGGGGTLAGPGASPTTAPILALASGSGVDDGAHDVTVVFKTASGRTLPSPVASIAVGTLPAPTVAPTVGVPKFGPGPDPGTHQFAYTEVTASGETTPSPLSAVVTTVAGVATPSVAPVASAAANIGLGSLTIGNSYSYKYAYANAGGFLTAASPASNIVTVTSSQRIQFQVPYSTNPAVTVIHFFQSDNGGAGTWKKIDVHLGGATAYGEIQNYTPGGTLTVDDQGSARTTNAPTVNEASSNTVPLTIPLASSTLVTSKNIYGTEAGGSQLKLIDSIGAATTAYDVDTLDADLGANVPTSNTATANQILATIPLGPTGTTDRELYMSQESGGARTLAETIANNVDTSALIDTSNATLAGTAAEPTSDTSGLSLNVGNIAAGETEIEVASATEACVDGGYAVIGNGTLAIRYTGVVGNTLVGVPSSGLGSIEAPIGYGSQITWSPALMDVAEMVYDGAETITTSRGLRLVALGTNPTDRLGLLTSSISSEITIDAIVLALVRVGEPSGSIWVTVQTGNIGPTGHVLATSALVDAASVGADTNVRFRLPDSLVIDSDVFIVLHGDYTRSDTDHIAWQGRAFGAPTTYEYSSDGTITAPISSVNGLYVTMWVDVLQHSIRKGDPVNLFVTVDDLDAQATLSAILDPDDEQDGAAGIIDVVMQDRRLSRAETMERAAARLSLTAEEDISCTYHTLDRHAHPSRTVEFDLDDPTTFTDTLKIRSVVRSWVDAQPAIFPICTVEASNKLLTFEQLLNRDM